MKTIDDVIYEAYHNLGIILDYDKLTNAVPNRKHRTSTISKPKSANGWYIVKHDASINFTTFIFGNWETGQTNKYHINSKPSIQKRKPLNTLERKALQADINNKIEADRLKQEQERQRKIEYYVAQYKRFNNCIVHSYTTKKCIENLHWFEFKEDAVDNLCIPFYNNAMLQCGYQTIAPDSQKMFCGGIGGNFWQYPLTNPDTTLFNGNNSFYILAEGVATCLSAWQAINNYWDNQIFLSYALVAFNCSNLDKVIKNTRHKNLAYFLLVDNDSSKPHNAGIETARQVISNNSDCQIYSLTFNNNNDANDFILLNGADKFIELLTKYTPIKSFIERPHNG